MKILENTQLSLYDIYRHFDEKRWILPAHQRKLAWDDQKINKWHEDIIQLHKEGGGTVPGCVITYDLVEQLPLGFPEIKKTYLNDGAQRVYWTLSRFIDYCKEKKLEGKNGWEFILNSVKITMQKVDYKNVNEAISNFIQINYGTTATPLELARTKFCESFSDYESFWEKKLERIHKAVETSLTRLGCPVEDRENIQKRELTHKRRRDEMHLFWKVISKDKTQFSPQVALTNIKPDRWNKQTELEQNLIDLLKEVKHEGLEEALAKFEKFITDNIAFYKQIWLERQQPRQRSPMEVPSNVHIRWWLIVVAYLQNCNVGIGVIREFTEKLIDYSEGRTTIFYKNIDGKNCNCNLAMSNIGNLGMIAKIIGINPSSLVTPEKRRRKRKKTVMPGFHASHVKSFSVVGEGETLFENALENCKRSARDMTLEEELRLRAIN